MKKLGILIAILVIVCFLLPMAVQAQGTTVSSYYMEKNGMYFLFQEDGSLSVMSEDYKDVLYFKTVATSVSVSKNIVTQHFKDYDVVYNFDYYTDKVKIAYVGNYVGSIDLKIDGGKYVGNYTYQVGSLVYNWADAPTAIAATTKDTITSVKLTTSGSFNIDPTIGSVSSVYGFRAVPQRKSFYCVGRDWLFYANNTYVSYSSSADKGSTWLAVTQTTIVANFGERFSAWTNGTYVYLSYFVNGGSLYYKRGTPLSNGTINWESVATVYDTAIVSGGAAITVDTGGHAWIYFCTGAQHTAGYVTRNDNLDGTWSTSAGFPYLVTQASPKWSSGGMVIPLTNEDVCVVHSEFTGGATPTLYSVTYDQSAGTWGANLTVNTGTNIYSDNVWTATSNAAQTIVYASWAVSSSGNKIYFDELLDPWAGAWGNPDTYIATMASSSGEWMPLISGNGTSDVTIYWQDHGNVTYTDRINGAWSSIGSIGHYTTSDDSGTNLVFYRAMGCHEGYATIDSSKILYWINRDFGSAPITDTQAADTSIGSTWAVLNGNYTTTVTTRGFSYGNVSGIYPWDWHEDGSWAAGVFEANITTLSPGMQYFYVAYATNECGADTDTVEQSFLTTPEPPTGFMAIHGLLHNDLSWTRGVGANNTIIYALEGAYPAEDRSDGAVLYNGTSTVALDSPLVYGEHWYYRAWSWSSKGGLTQWSATSVVSDADPYTYPSVGNLTSVVNSGCSVTMWGNVSLIGDTQILERGFEWGLVSGVYTTGWHEHGSWGVGNFTYTWTSADDNTLYYWIAYAINETNTRGDSTEGNFTSAAVPAPTVLTLDPVTAISYTTALAHGNVTNYGDPCEHIDIRGFEWGLVSGVYTGNKTEVGWFIEEPFSLTLTGLPPNTLIFYRAHAFNAHLVGYGAEGNFTTLLPLPCAPTDFVATRTGTEEITITWTKGCYSATTIIRMSSDSCPANPTDGWDIYAGNGTSVVYSPVSEFVMDTYCIRGWGNNSIGYSLDYAEAKIGGGSMALIFFAALSIGLTVVGLRSRYPLIPWVAGLSWWVLAFYIKGNPPMGITEGDSTHTMLWLLLIAMGLAVPLYILWRGTSRKQNYDERGHVTGYSDEHAQGGWHFPDWSKGPEARRRAENNRRQADTDDYREQFHSALNPRDRRR